MGKKFKEWIAIWNGKWLVCLLFVVLLWGIGATKTNAATVGDLSYTITDKEVTITGCDTSASGELIIPEEIEGYPVSQIGSWAFSLCRDLTSIKIPEGVTIIGSSAFSRCSNLISVTIPESVLIIAGGAFDECDKLEEIHITDIKAWCEITFGNESANPLYYGGSLYLNEKKVTELIVPQDVTTINDYAFNGSASLTSITIPKNVTSIGYKVFNFCEGLTSIMVDEENTIYHSSGNCLIKTASKNLILGCKTSRIPNDGTVTSLDGFAFNGCVGLESISIPENVTHINGWVFSNCINLKTIFIPKTLVSISWNAFVNTDLQTVYYCGTQEEWYNIEIKSGNEELQNAKQIFCSGTCGENTIWKLNEYGTLLINGNGETYNYISYQQAPWYEYRMQIKKVIIANTITRIGNNSFSCLTNLECLKVENPNTLFGQELFSKSITFTIECMGGGYVEKYANENGYTLVKPQNTEIPIAVQIEKICADSVVLRAVVGYEYSLDGVNWQTSNIFVNLVSGQEYTFYQRIASNIYSASVSSEGINVTTLVAPESPIIESIVKNIATLAITEGYEYSIDGVNWQNNNVFEIPMNVVVHFYQRVAAKGNCDATPASISAKGISISAPTVLVGSTSIHIKPVEGCKYDFEGMGIWQIDNVFRDGIVSGESYSVQQKYVGEDNVFAIYDEAGSVVVVNGDDIIEEPKECHLSWLRNLLVQNEKSHNIAADFNGDFEIDIKDVVRLKKQLSGIMVSLKQAYYEEKKYVA